MWVAIGMGTLLLLVAGIRKNEAQHCKGVEVDIEAFNNNFFLDQSDILHAISAMTNGNPVGKSIRSFKLKFLENELRKNPWVKTAELFFDNNAILQVKVDEREPVARVFTELGNTFYVDGELSLLPLSEKFSARLPVFTGFPSEKANLSNADSNLLKDIRLISLAIRKDSFLMAMIEQVDIRPGPNFTMIPKIGDQLIVFGDGTELTEKFNRLKLFYKEIMSKTGWNKYSVIDLQFRNQVVAKKKADADIIADSLRTKQLMKIIAENAEKMAGDSLKNTLQEMEKNGADSTLIQHSTPHEDNRGQAIEKVSTVISTLKNNAGTEDRENSRPLKKPATAHSIKSLKKPKAIMPEKNEY